MVLLRLWLTSLVAVTVLVSAVPVLAQGPSPQDQAIARYAAEGKPHLAIPLAEKAVGDLRKTVSKTDVRLAFALHRLAVLHIQISNFSAALPLLREALAINEGIGNLGNVGAELTELGVVYTGLGDLEKAGDHFRRARAALEKSITSSHPGYAQTLDKEAKYFLAAGRVDEAVANYRTSVKILRRKLGDRHPAQVVPLQALAEAYAQSGDPSKADKTFEHALTIAEDAMGRDHPALIQLLTSIATFYLSAARYDEAEDMATRAVTVMEKAGGPNHPALQKPLLILAQAHTAAGRRDRALPVLNRALTITQAAVGPDHPSLLNVLQAIAQYQQQAGDHAKAQPVLERMLKIASTHFGKDNQSVVPVLLSLAAVEQALSHNGKAINLLRRSVAITEKLGAENPALLQPLTQLGGLLASQAEYDEAEQVLRRVIAIAETTGQGNPAMIHALTGLANIQVLQGRTAAATVLLRRALKTGKGLGDAHPLMVMARSLLANNYSQLGKHERARREFEKAVKAVERARGKDHPDLIPPLDGLAQVHRAKGDYANAGKILERTLGIAERAWGTDDLRLTQILDGLGNYYAATRDPRAEATHARAMAIRRSKLGADHPQIAMVIHLRGLSAQQQGRLQDAEKHLKAALEMRERVYGSTHPDVAVSLSALGGLYQATAQLDRAEVLLTRSLEISTAHFGKVHPQVALTLSSVASLRHTQGRFGDAAALSRQQLSVEKKLYGAQDVRVALTMMVISGTHLRDGRPWKARALVRQARRIFAKVLGNDHPYMANTFTTEGRLEHAEGHYQLALQRFERAITILKAASDVDPAAIADVLFELSLTYQTLGDEVRANTSLEEALKLLETQFGTQHPALCRVLTAMAGQHISSGNYRRASPLISRAHSIMNEHHGPDHPDLAPSLLQLAILEFRSAEYDRAAILVQQAVDLMEKSAGADSPLLLTPLYLQSLVHMARKETGTARAANQRAIRITEKHYGEGHPSLANSYRIMALLEWQQNHPDSAERAMRRSIKIIEKTGGRYNPELAINLRFLAQVQVGRSKKEAIASTARSTAIEEKKITRMLTMGSSRERNEFIASLYDSTHWVLSMHLLHAPTNTDAAKMAFETLLRRKGRALDAGADIQRRLWKSLSKASQKTFGELREVRSELANLAVRGPRSDVDVYTAEYDALEAREEKLTSTLATENRQFASNTAPITMGDVAKVLPSDAALVEFMVFWPMRADLHDHPDDTYQAAVYILTPGGKLAWVHLGDFEPIAAAASAFKSALHACADTKAGCSWDRDKMRIVAAGQAIDALVMAKIRPHLGDATHLFVSPEGPLSHIPFGAMVDDRGRFLLERFGFTYLSSGRDLVRLKTATSPRTGPVIIADPDFGDSSNARAGTRGRFEGMTWTRLKGTNQEAHAIAKVLRDSTLLLGPKASEAALKGVKGPQILHLATHGFFLDSEQTSAGTRGFKKLATTQLLAGGNDIGEPGHQIENPLLRSGIVLSGANELASGDEDGVVTAAELSGMDLWGTELVVMSACETGLGELRMGQGVFGLRRAFTLAGARSQVMSLWSVSDAATARLMTDYYQRLKRGEGRTEGLRRARLELMGKDAWRHPYFWAAFIPSGDWRKMSF